MQRLQGLPEAQRPKLGATRRYLGGARWGPLVDAGQWVEWDAGSAPERRARPLPKPEPAKASERVTALTGGELNPQALPY